jgi:hypothetical protein
LARSRIDYRTAIANSGRTIYDRIRRSEKTLWIPDRDLEKLIQEGLTGTSLKDLPLRTRSKVVKSRVCESLGYPVPQSFRKSKPRFPGQDVDTYTQKADNLQIWNEEISPTRRYALIRVDESGEIVKVRVIRGCELEKLDTTGTLTQKFQAKLKREYIGKDSFYVEDTASIAPICKATANLAGAKPTDLPTEQTILTIEELHCRLRTLVGKRIEDAGYDQERNRAATLHRLAVETIGYETYQDSGQFPDVPNQMLEVKLQTSPTIDLGLVLPDSEEELETVEIGDKTLRHCDTRYAVFYGRTDGKTVEIEKVHLIPGRRFFDYFQQFQGKIANKKIQIPLPKDFFL